MKNFLRTKRARTFAFIAVAAIFVLSGFMGGALAPVIQSVSASTGAHNKVVANYNITNLPRQQILLGTDYDDTTKGADVPKMLDPDDGSELTTSGFVRLYRMSSSRPVEVTGWKTSGKYDHLGPYEWRFYATHDEENVDKYIHMHSVQVVQESYTLNVPESAQHEIDGGVVSFIPNVTVRDLDVTLPLPNRFIDRKGNDLFDEKTKDVKELRGDVIQDWDGAVVNPMQKPVISTSEWSVDLDDLNEDELAELDNFKLLVYANTQIKFYGTDDNTDRDSGRFVNVTENRTFVPDVPGDHYYAEYEFVHPSITSKYRTSNISVEHTGFSKEQVMGEVTTNPDGSTMNNTQRENEKKASQIRFEIPPAFSGTVGTNAMTINQDFKLPLPTVNLTRETDTTKIEYNPVKFSRATSVTSYTYITVEHYSNSGPNVNTETGSFKDVIIDETTDYTFRPTLPGRYAFLYHTTTLFGTGYTAHLAGGTGTAKIDTEGKFFTYYPYSMIHITTNEVRPEVKWSVPFKYATIDDIAVKLGVDVSGKAPEGFTDTTAYKNFKDYKVGDAIALPGYEDLFGVKEDEVLERHGEKDFYQDAPNLVNYMPSAGTSPLTQISSKQALILPALLGFNNVDSGSELNYTIVLTRFENDQEQTPRITFSSSPTVVVNAHTFEYDNTQPLVLNFGDTANIDTDYGYGTGGHLAAWKDASSKTGRYQIEVYAIDNSTKEFGSTGTNRTSISSYYSFNVVTDSQGSSDNQFLMPQANPEFSGRLSMMQTAFYEDDTIVFNKIGVNDEYTLDVQVKYWIIADGIEVELDDTFIKNDTTFSFDLTTKNKKAADILKEVKKLTNNGVIDLDIVAVAKNYFALSNSVDNKFKPNDDDYVFTMDDLKKYIENPKAFEKECANCSGTGLEGLEDCSVCIGEGTIDVMRGIAVEIFPIKVYNQLIYGDTAVIGLVNDPDSPAYADTIAAGEYTEFDGINDYWKALFGVTNSKVYQNTPIYFPTFTVGYDCECVGPCVEASHKVYRTAIEFQIIQPVRKDPIGVTGGTTQILPITQGEANREEINSLSFYAEEIGVHTFVCRVYNGGGYVSVFTAQVNVVGSPVTVPILKGGVPTMRVAQKADLPWVEVTIDGKPFITRDGSIYVDYAPYEVIYPKGITGSPIKFDDVPTAGEQQEYLKVGTYTIKAESFGGGPIPSTIGGFFIPTAADTYRFTYELRIDTGALNDLCISVDSTNPYYYKSIYHDIVVSGLNADDIGIAFQDKGYSDLDAIDSYRIPNAIGTGTTKIDNDSSATEKDRITPNNVLTQMTSSSARDISMGLQRLNSAMYQTYTGIPTLGADGRITWEDDRYEFGKIYLPNMYAEWADDLTQLYGFNLPEVSRVTVAHSRRSNDFLFDSKGINDKDRTERKYIDTGADGDGDRYYWFQPAGSVYVAKPRINLTAAEATALSLPTQATMDALTVWNLDEVAIGTSGTNSLVRIGGGIKYYWDVRAGAKNWYYFDADEARFQSNGKDIKYHDAKYGYGNSRFVDPNITPDGVYNVTYLITYGGITSTVEFKISIGDTATPIIEFAKNSRGKSYEEILFGSSYKKDRLFEVNTSDAIRVMPNGGRLNELESDGSFARWYVAKNLKVTVLRPGGQTDIPLAPNATANDGTPNGDYLHRDPYLDETIKPKFERGVAGDKMDEWGYKLEIKAGCTEAGCSDGCVGHRIPVAAKDVKEDRTWYFKLTESGDYRITFEIQSESGQPAYLTRTITVDPPKSKTKISPQTVWGTILIVLASGLLLAVVVYFIQTGRKTKFASSQLKAKKVKNPDGEV